MYFDKPIESLEEDVLERVYFAKHIAKLFILPPHSPSVVFAIEGTWGSSKTSVINLIKKQLEVDSQKPIVIDFNAWLIGSIDSVIEGFLVQFASSIGGKLQKKELAKKAATTILNLGKFLAPIKLIPGVVL